MKSKTILLFLLIIFLLNTSAFSQGDTERTSLNYTYMGPIISAGYSTVEYSDWLDSEYGSESSSGTTFGAGLALCIFTDKFLGSTRIKYVYNGAESITYADFSFSGSYLWKTSEKFNIGTGLGIYCETPPASKSFDGSAGVELPVTFIYNITLNSKLIAELNARYGSLYR